MKNVAIIVPTLNKGGAERVAANLSVEFAKYYHVYVIVHDGRNITYPYGGTLIDLKLPPSPTKAGKVLTLLKRIAAVRKLKKQLQIDVSISHLIQSDYVNIFSRYKDKVFTTAHSMKGEPFFSKMVSMLSDQVICVSECVRWNMVETYGVSKNKTAVVYNFCDLEVPERENPDSGALTVVNLGRLSEPKGQWHLLRAMKIVFEETNMPVQLKIIGDGEMRESLERLADRLGIRSRVIFTGFCKEPWSHLVNADLYVSSSLWEGLPMALIEAGNCGLPIISTDCDAGCREILAPDTPVRKKADGVEYARYGVLVPVCEPADAAQTEPTEQERIMASAILEMLSDQQLRTEYAQKAKLRAVDFRPEKIMRQWKELIGE